MATKILMPKLSDTMTEGVILKWLKQEGEKVKQGDILVEIESDKADMELEAYDSGVLRKIAVPDGGKAGIGALIAIIGEADEDITSLLQDAPAVQKPAPVPPSVQAPGTPPSAPAVAQAVPAAPAPAGDNRLKVSPVARKLADERQVDLRSVAGSGPQGRIVKKDIETAAASPAPQPALQPAPLPGGTSSEADLSLIRRTIAKRMTDSKTTIPHFYVTMAVDMEPASEFRRQLIEASGAKISFTDILVKACALALMKHPNVNGTYLGEKIRVNNFAHIAVAVAMDDGLVTPVVRNAQTKGIAQINGELRDLVERARNRKLKPEEYSGSTFSISNLGMFGVEDFAAIVNPPESAILAVGAITEKPVVKNGQVVPGKVMNITLSSDHRIIDGAVAARFLQDLKKFLENPASLAL